jgi:hypothetical protein
MPNLKEREERKMRKKRMKKMMISSILFLAIAVLSSPAWATSSSCPDVYLYDDGYAYSITGSMKLSVTFKDYVSASVTLPNLGNLMELAGGYGYGENFYFFSDNGIGDDLLYSLDKEAYYYIGEWTQSGCNLYMDFSILAGLLTDMLAAYGVEGEVTGSTKTTAKISSKDGTNSGKVSIGIAFYSPLEGNLSVSLTFKGYPFGSLDKKAAQSVKMSKPLVQRNKASLNPEIKNFLASVFSKLPKKGDPGLLPSHKK